MAELLKNKVREIINNRPEGTTPEGIVASLIQRGHTLEGYGEVKETQEPAETGPSSSGLRELKQLGTGVGKGVLSTMTGAAELGLKTFGRTGEKLGSFLSGKKLGGIDESLEAIGEEKKLLKPEGTLEKVGFGAEQLAEFFVPVGGAAKTASIVNRLISGTGKLKTAAGFLGKVVGEGAEFAAKRTLQRGDAEELVGSFLLGGAVQVIGGLGAISAKGIFKALPERLYKQVFRIAEDDLKLAIQTQARGQNLNPTLAKEVLDRGLFGTSQGMATYSVRKLDKLESQLQNLVKGDELVTVGNKNVYVNLLNDLATKFKGGFFTGRAREARNLIKQLGEAPSRKMKAITSLRIKRFFDKMRNTSSFRLDPNLSARQEEYKLAADLMRKNLKRDVKGTAEILNEERVFIQAFESIIEDAVRRQNRRLLNLTDILLGGGGLAAGGPFGAAIGIGAIRGFQQPLTLTGLGLGLFKGGKVVEKLAPAARTGVKGTAAFLASGRNEE